MHSPASEDLQNIRFIFMLGRMPGECGYGARELHLAGEGGGRMQKCLCEGWLYGVAEYVREEVNFVQVNYARLLTP